MSIYEVVRQVKIKRLSMHKCEVLKISLLNVLQIYTCVGLVISDLLTEVHMGITHDF